MNRILDDFDLQPMQADEPRTGHGASATAGEAAPSSGRGSLKKTCRTADFVSVGDAAQTFF
jgi:hypothetical protein